MTATEQEIAAMREAKDRAVAAMNQMGVAALGLAAAMKALSEAMEESE